MAVPWPVVAVLAPDERVVTVPDEVPRVVLVEWLVAAAPLTLPVE